MAFLQESLASTPLVLTENWHVYGPSGYSDDANDLFSEIEADSSGFYEFEYYMTDSDSEYSDESDFENCEDEFDNLNSNNNNSTKKKKKNKEKRDPESNCPESVPIPDSTNHECEPLKKKQKKSKETTDGKSLQSDNVSSSMENESFNLTSKSKKKKKHKEADSEQVDCDPSHAKEYDEPPRKKHKKSEKPSGSLDTENVIETESKPKPKSGTVDDDDDFIVKKAVNNIDLSLFKKLHKNNYSVRKGQVAVGASLLSEAEKEAQRREMENPKPIVGKNTPKITKNKHTAKQIPKKQKDKVRKPKDNKTSKTTKDQGKNENRAVKKDHKYKADTPGAKSELVVHSQPLNPEVELGFRGSNLGKVSGYMSGSPATMFVSVPDKKLKQKFQQKSKH